jgi:hypothetical protein
VNVFANVLRLMDVKRGDRVTIYLPMIPEAAFAMLACARIGAIHSVVFGGFSPDSLAGRIADCKSKLVITADEGLRGGKKIKLKHNTDEALTKSLGDEKVIVIRRTGGSCAIHAGRDFWYHELAAKVATDCPPEEMSAEDPLFILYTSGSTGMPSRPMTGCDPAEASTTRSARSRTDGSDTVTYWLRRCSRGDSRDSTHQPNLPRVRPATGHCSRWQWCTKTTTRRPKASRARKGSPFWLSITTSGRALRNGPSPSRAATMASPAHM